MTDDKALVLGASGFLGSHVVKALVAAGRPVRILTRASSNTAMTDHLDLDRQTGDIFDRETLRKAMSGCSSVLQRIMGDYDNSKARRELGWEPRPMDESLKEAAIWFKENP